MTDDARPHSYAPEPPRRGVAIAVLVYVALALGTDLLASLSVTWTFGVLDEGFRWRVLHHSLAGWRDVLPLPAALTGWMDADVLRTLDVYKVLVWLVIPVAVSLPRMDWGALGFRRWKRADVYLLAGLAVVGLGAVLLITQVDALRQFYPSLRHHTAAWKWHYCLEQLVWIGSWLLGWEFMHRYFLLRHVNGLWPRFGWLAVPAFEAAYHLTKLPIEAAGMLAIGVAFTYWSRRRGNMMLPLLVHLVIELALPITRIVV